MKPPLRLVLLALLADADRLAEDMGDVVSRLVEAARLEQCSWAEIGRALGTTRQAAQARYGRHIPETRKDAEAQ